MSTRKTDTREAITSVAASTWKRIKPQHISPRGRVMLIGGGLAAIVIISFISPYFHLPSKTIVKAPADTSTHPTPTTSAEPVSQTPDYTTMLPAGKTIDTVGGWSRVSPPDRNPVFAYADKIGSTPITVSQQPLPDDFKQNTDEKITTFAKAYNADQKVTALGTTIYIGTSAKGPQSVIFSKNGLLVLIKSTAKIDNSQWIKYISSLQ